MAKNNTYDADSITVLEGLEAVRKRPGMYIGSVSTKGLNHLIYEIVDNAVDEHLAGFCTEIHVTLEKETTSTPADGKAYVIGEKITYQITVTNDGNLTATNLVVTDELTGNSGANAWKIESLATEGAKQSIYSRIYRDRSRRPGR